MANKNSTLSPGKTYAQVLAAIPEDSIAEESTIPQELSKPEDSLDIISSPKLLPGFSTPPKTYAEVASHIPLVYNETASSPAATPATPTTSPQLTPIPCLPLTPTLESGCKRKEALYSPVPDDLPFLEDPQPWPTCFAKPLINDHLFDEVCRPPSLTTDSLLITSFTGIPLFEATDLTPDTIASAVLEPSLNHNFRVTEIPMEQLDRWKLSATGLNQDGEAMKYVVEGKPIVAFTINVFEETPRGRIWQIQSTNRIAFKVNRKLPGLNFPIETEDLVKISWEIKGFDGLIYSFTAFGLPGMALRLTREGIPGKKFAIPSVRRASCHGCFVAEDGHWAGMILVPLEDNNPPLTSGSERWRFLKVPSLNVGDQIIAWHMRGRDERILHTAIAGPSSMSHTAQISDQSTEYRSIARALVPENPSSKSRFIVTWELRDDTSRKHVFTAEAEIGWGLQIIKTKDKFPASSSSTECTAKGSYPAPRYTSNFGEGSAKENEKTSDDTKSKGKFWHPRNKKNKSQGKRSFTRWVEDQAQRQQHAKPSQADPLAYPRPSRAGLPLRQNQHYWPSPEITQHMQIEDQQIQHPVQTFSQPMQRLLPGRSHEIRQPIQVQPIPQLSQELRRLSDLQQEQLMQLRDLQLRYRLPQQQCYPNTY